MRKLNLLPVAELRAVAESIVGTEGPLAVKIGTLLLAAPFYGAHAYDNHWLWRKLYGFSAREADRVGPRLKQLGLGYGMRGRAVRRCHWNPRWFDEGAKGQLAFCLDVMAGLGDVKKFGDDKWGLPEWS